MKRTSPNAAPVYDVIQSFMLTALTDGRRFSHVARLREDPTIPELFRIEVMVGDGTVRRFLTEVKKGDRSLSPALPYFQAETKAAHAFQVVIDLPFEAANCFSRHQPLIVPAKTFLSQLI